MFRKVTCRELAHITKKAWCEGVTTTMRRLLGIALCVVCTTATAYSKEKVVTNSRVDINNDGKKERVSLVMTAGRQYQDSNWCGGGEATEQTTKCLRELLAIATPEDVGWITKKLQDIPLGNTAQGALNDLQRRAQQKP